MGLTQEEVAQLLGHKSNARVCNYEGGKQIPTLATAVKLELILCTPLAYLFPDFYRHVKNYINANKETLKTQQRTA